MKKSILFTMLLAGLTLWLGCEKDDFNLPQENVQQPALQIPTDMAALLSAEELNYIENAYEGALIKRRDEDVILPLMIQMDVYLSYSLVRETNPGEERIDIIISGTGTWAETGQTNFFEVQYEPDLGGSWVGEGFIGTESHSHTMYIFFKSEPDPNASDGCLDNVVLSAKQEFTRGTSEFRGVTGDAIRKVFVSEDDSSKGELLVCGYLFLPGGKELAPFEVELEDGAPD